MRPTIMVTEAAQLRLLTWFSPAFPVGAFGYSHGLETAIREGRVTGAETLEAWILGLLEHGSGWTDAVLFRVAWAAADAAEIAELGELAEALAPSRERHRETMQLGAAFMAAVQPWSRTPPQSLRDSAPASGGASSAQILNRAAGEAPAQPAAGAFGAAIPYPVAAGSACADAGIPLASALTAWLHGFAANLVSVAVRAVPIGQGAALAVLAALEPALLAVAERVAAATLDDLGSCACLSDIAAMRHETLQPRLFIS